MKCGALVLVLAATCLVVAAEKKGQAPGADPFARPVKILRFGEVIPYYDPSKGDAVAALGLLGDERVVPVLIEHLVNEKDHSLRSQIVRALGWIGSRKAVSALEKVLKDEDHHVRRLAAMALKEITGKDYKVEQEKEPDFGGLMAELARIQEANRRPGRPSLEVGKTFRFSFGQQQRGDLEGKVLEEPAGNWVKVQVRKGDTSVTSWVNLTAVAVVTAAKD